MRQLLVMYLTGGLVLCALSLPLALGKIPPNPVYGFRVPSTLRDAGLWYPANRYAGKGLLGAGAVITAAAGPLYLVPGITVDAYAIAELVVVVVALTLVVTASVLYLRRLQRRAPQQPDPTRP